MPAENLVMKTGNGP